MPDSTLLWSLSMPPWSTRPADRVRAGDSLYRITRDWNATGHRTANGVLWSEKALVQILRNPALKGVRVYHPTLPDGRPTPEPEIVTTGNWTPILDANTWAEVVAVPDARKAARQGGRYSTKRLYPFSGLIRCARCGNPMRKQGRNYICRNYVRGACARSINVAQVTEVIRDAVLSVFDGIDIHQPRNTSDRDAEQARLHEQLTADRAALARLDDDYYDGVIDRAAWGRQRGRLTDRITTTQHQHRRAVSMVATAEVDPATVAAEWDHHGPAWQHEVTRLVLETVLVHEHPAGVASVVSKHRDEPREQYQQRLSEYRQELVAKRIELIWTA